MEYLISFAPHAIAVVASVVSVGVGYYFWNKYQKQTEEIRAEKIRAEEIRAEKIRADAIRAEKIRTEEIRAEKIRAEEIRAEKIRTDAIRAEKIRADIINETTKNHIKILFVGPNEAGKSSLINTFVSAMENKRVKTAVAAGPCFEGNTKNFSDYYIEDNGEPIITLLDTSGIIATLGNSNDAVLENIKKALDGNLPYGQNMLEQVPDGSKFMEPIDIVVFVYSATNELTKGCRFQRYLEYGQQFNALKSLHKHVTNLNIANMLVLTHTDCKERIYIERLTEIFKNELGYEASDIHLIKCLVDFQVTRDTNIPTAERAHALGVLYAITHDGVEKKKMMESRHKYRQT